MWLYLLIFAFTFKNPKTAQSARLFQYLLSGRIDNSSSKESISSLGNFQTIRKASPRFLFDDPRCRSTSEWTTSAIWFTKSITSSSKASVASANPRISQNPKTASSLDPAMRGLKSFPISEDAILFPIILAPASPNHRPRSLPRVKREDSRKAVSFCCTSTSFFFLSFFLFLL